MEETRTQGKMPEIGSSPPDDKNPETPPPTAPPAADVEAQTPAAGFGGGAILRRWRRADSLKKSYLALRGLALLFSLLSFVIMASNQHDDWKSFDRYQEYRYVLAIAILSSLYTGGQILRQICEIYNRKVLFSRRNLALVDFIGDQVVAYLLISSASAAVPLTNRMRENADNIFTDSSTSAISMSFLAFFMLAFSAIISGYELANANQSFV